MAALSIGTAAAFPSTTALSGSGTVRIRHRIMCIGWTGHIARLEFKRQLEKDADARESFERQVQEEKDRRRALRESRRVPVIPTEMVEYFLDTEAQEIEFEIARMRLRLDEEFFAHLRMELGQLRFAVSKTQDMEDRLIELEALQKALLEGIEAYDKMLTELVTAKESLTKILTSKNVKSTRRMRLTYHCWHFLTKI
ncbi:hypothetical protein SAY86_027123 [Trapa natans]|uniref:Uncharacterized protein n=1 Tax=Trapa natans TaxID=22666 RepID=A0AAN7KGY2_TRANT|nr:hypothetical protein SAY86_027123 [Trapa natans]